MDKSWQSLKSIDYVNNDKAMIPNKSSALPQLMYRQIIPSMDPRLQGEMPESSVYKTYGQKMKATFVSMVKKGQPNSKEKVIVKITEQGASSLSNREVVDGIKQMDTSRPSSRASSGKVKVKPSLISSPASESKEKLEASKFKKCGSSDLKVAQLHAIGRTVQPLDMKVAIDDKKSFLERMSAGSRQISANLTFPAFSQLLDASNLPEDHQTPLAAPINTSKDAEMENRRSRTRHFASLSLCTQHIYRKQGAERLTLVDDMAFVLNRKTMKDLDGTLKGSSINFVKNGQHLKPLSVKTQTGPAQQTVQCKKIEAMYIKALREWKVLRPLDLLVLGVEKFYNIEISPLKPCLVVDDVAEECHEELNRSLFKVLRCMPIDQVCEGLLGDIDCACEEIGTDALRQLKLYWQFLWNQLSSRAVTSEPEEEEDIFEDSLLAQYVINPLARKALAKISAAANLKKKSIPVTQKHKMEPEVPVLMKKPRIENTSRNKVKHLDMTDEEIVAENTKPVKKQVQAKMDVKKSKILLSTQAEKTSDERRIRDGIVSEKVQDKTLGYKKTSSQPASKADTKNVSSSRDRQRTKESDKIPCKYGEVRVPLNAADPSVVTYAQKLQAQKVLQAFSDVFFRDSKLLKVAVHYGFCEIGNQDQASSGSSKSIVRDFHDNPCALTWCVLQFFTSSNKIIQHLDQVLPKFLQLEGLEPTNNFVWAMLLCLNEKVLKVMDLSKKQGKQLSAETIQHSLRAGARQTEGEKTLTNVEKSGTFADSMFKPPLGDGDNKTAMQREEKMYSVYEITRTPDVVFADSIVKAKLMNILQDTAALLKERVSDVITCNVTTCLLPIVGNSVTLIRANLPFALRLTNKYLDHMKIKGASDVFEIEKEEQKSSEDGTRGQMADDDGSKITMTFPQKRQMPKSEKKDTFTGVKKPKPSYPFESVKSFVGPMKSKAIRLPSSISANSSTGTDGTSPSTKSPLSAVIREKLVDLINLPIKSDSSTSVDSELKTDSVQLSASPSITEVSDSVETPALPVDSEIPLPSVPIAESPTMSSPTVSSIVVPPPDSPPLLPDSLAFLSDDLPPLPDGPPPPLPKAAPPLESAAVQPPVQAPTVSTTVPVQSTPAPYQVPEICDPVVQPPLPDMGAPPQMPPQYPPEPSANYYHQPYSEGYAPPVPDPYPHGYYPYLPDYSGMYNPQPPPFYPSFEAFDRYDPWAPRWESPWHRDWDKYPPPPWHHGSHGPPYGRNDWFPEPYPKKTPLLPDPDRAPADPGRMLADPSRRPLDTTGRMIADPSRMPPYPGRALPDPGKSLPEPDRALPRPPPLMDLKTQKPIMPLLPSLGNVQEPIETEDEQAEVNAATNTDEPVPKKTVDKPVKPIVSTGGAFARDYRLLILHREKHIPRNDKRFSQLLEGKLLHPFNIGATIQQPHIEHMVLIQREDKGSVHEIPNLLKLKQLPQIKFVLFTEPEDILNRHFQSVMVKGGTVTVDGDFLTSTSLDNIRIILDFMHYQTNSNDIPWMLQIHKRMLAELQEKKDDPETSEEDQHYYSEVLGVLKHYEDEGVVDELTKHYCDHQKKVPEEYLDCCRHQQAKHMEEYRHNIFLTEMLPSSTASQEFLKSGIGVLNVEGFIKYIVTPALKNKKPVSASAESMVTNSRAEVSSKVAAISVPPAIPVDSVQALPEDQEEDLPASTSVALPKGVAPPSPLPFLSKFQGGGPVSCTTSAAVQEDWPRSSPTPEDEGPASPPPAAVSYPAPLMGKPELVSQYTGRRPSQEDDEMDLSDHDNGAVIEEFVSDDPYRYSHQPQGHGWSRYQGYPREPRAERPVRLMDLDPASPTGTYDPHIGRRRGPRLMPMDTVSPDRHYDDRWHAGEEEYDDRMYRRPVERPPYERARHRTDIPIERPRGRPYPSPYSDPVEPVMSRVRGRMYADRIAPRGSRDQEDPDVLHYGQGDERRNVSSPSEEME